MFRREHRSAHYQEDPSEDNRLSLQYALGQVTGSYVAEKLCFKPNDPYACLAHTIEFLLVTESKDTENYYTSGFMGLAPTQVNPYGAPAFIEQVHYYGRD